MEGQQKIVFMLLIFVFVTVSGCETAKGLKKDVENTWENAKKIDDNFKENWW